MKRLTSIFASTLTVAALTISPLLNATASQQAESQRGNSWNPNPQRPGSQWVSTWTTMPQLTEPRNMPPEPFTQDGSVMANTTLRQTLHTTTAGTTLRLRFSNAFGGADLPITAVSVARPEGGQAGVSAIEAGTSRPVTFSGERSTVVPVGAQVVSDPLRFPHDAQENLTVTLYLADGQASNKITSHPGSRTTSYLVKGNHVNDTDLEGATPVNHWYFLSGMEVRAKRSAAAVAILGDSLTGGRGSTTNGNNRWPDELATRLQAHPATKDVAVLNQAAGGNRVLNDGLGPNALSRLDRDVLAKSGVEWMIVFEGINDIGTAKATKAAQQRVAQDLIAAYDQMITRAHAQGIRVYGATLLPFGGNEMYDDPNGRREAARQRVNHWIRNSGRFDAVIDLAKVARDLRNPSALLPKYDVGDHLHLNPTGYQALADAVPLHLFTHHRGPRSGLN